MELRFSCMLHAACCMIHASCCSLHATCCSLHAAHCMLLAHSSQLTAHSAQFALLTADCISLTPPHLPRTTRLRAHQRPGPILRPTRIAPWRSLESPGWDEERMCVGRDAERRSGNEAAMGWAQDWVAGTRRGWEGTGRRWLGVMGEGGHGRAIVHLPRRHDSLDALWLTLQQRPLRICPALATVALAVPRVTPSRAPRP